MTCCGNCGAQAGPTQRFCLKCGQPLAEPKTTAPEGWSAPQGAVYPPEAKYPRSARTQTQPRRRPMWPWLTLGGVLVVAAIGLVMGLVVFAGAGGPASTPQETVRRALAAAEDEDTDSLFPPVAHAQA
jgi:hypothetical protein